MTGISPSPAKQRNRIRPKKYVFKDAKFGPNFLGDKRNWYEGLITIAEPPEQPTDIGLLFRSDHADLALFFDMTGVIQGEFHGERTIGVLEREREAKMKEWKHRYARRELAVK